MTIHSKFYTTQNTVFSIPEYQYFIVGTNEKVTRAEKDVFTNVFENHTYVLKAGQLSSMSKTYGESDVIGYTEIVKEVV